jgi:choline dehydrogenase-like flavoprotein
VRDAIVVGAGGGGAVVAKELAAHGLDVLVLEAGPRFAAPEREWSHFSQESSNPTTGYFRWPYARELHPSAIVVQQVAGVGGSTLHYSANCPRAMPGVFQGYAGRDRGAYDARHRFPFGYRHLIPYYEWVEHTLPVQTAPMGTKEEAFFEGARRAGLPVNRFKDVTRPSFRPQENAILQPGGTAGRGGDPADATFPRATGCTFCGHCFEGCFSPLGAPRNLKAKRSTDNSYVPMALTADRWSRGGRAVELVAGSFVERIEVRRRGGSATATGVSWSDARSGEGRVEHARVVVLAGGAIESPRLWLNSRLPDPNGWVGRGLTSHFEELVIGVMPFETGYSKGPASAARADFPGRGCLQNQAIGPAGTAALLAAGGVRRRGRADRGRSSGRLVGPDLTRFLGDVDRLLAIVVLTDDDVDPRNRVSLAGRLAADAHGRVPRIDLPARGMTARSRRNRRFLVEQAERILAQAGALAIHVSDGPPVLGHIHGTLRMGARRGDSVLDRHGEARWVHRLFVADNSALPNALGGPNPTLTTQALATRVAERVLQRYFDGAPWVTRDAPVSSIDDRVTAAVQERGL